MAFAYSFYFDQFSMKASLILGLCLIRRIYSFSRFIQQNERNEASNRKMERCGIP